jgi:hypothetical protein
VVIRPRQLAWTVRQCFLVKGQVWSPPSRAIRRRLSCAPPGPARAFRKVRNIERLETYGGSVARGTAPTSIRIVVLSTGSGNSRIIHS